jgi:hypothetical protein
MEQQANYATQPAQGQPSQEDITVLAQAVLAGQATMDQIPEEIRGQVQQVVEQQQAQQQQIQQQQDQGMGQGQAPQQQDQNQIPQQQDQKPNPVDDKIGQLVDMVNSGEVTIEQIAAEDQELANVVQQQLGGGADGNFSKEQLSSLVDQYIAGDIAKEELDQLPPADKQAFVQLLQAKANAQ